jgi:hypothetical protein
MLLKWGLGNPVVLIEEIKAKREDRGDKWNGF